MEISHHSTLQQFPYTPYYPFRHCVSLSENFNRLLQPSYETASVFRFVHIPVTFKSELAVVVMMSHEEFSTIIRPFL